MKRRCVGFSTPCGLAAMPWVLLAAVLAVILPACGASTPTAGLGGARATLHIIDAGQGDALLVETGGQRVLIDAGDWWGGGEVVQYLQAREIHQLEAVIVTHPAPDHSGGMEQVLARIPVARFLDAGTLGGGATYRRLLAEAARRQIPYSRLKAGDAIQLGEGAVLEVLAPFDELHEEPLANEEPDPTLVLRLKVGAVSFLLTSRLNARGEARLVRIYGSELEATVLKVPNHGDRRTTGAALLTAVEPAVAVITAGIYNEFGHPHAPVLERLEEACVEILRTDRHGHIRFFTDGRQLAWQTEYRP